MMLHDGGKEQETPHFIRYFEATMGMLDSVPLPPETRTYLPIGHRELIETVREGFSSSVGLEPVEESLSLARGGNQMFYVGRYGHCEELGTGLAVGLRNSYDKSLAAGMCCGAKVFVCDNLCFDGDVVVFRKHTKHGMRDVRKLVSEAAELAEDRFYEMVADFDAFREAELSEEEGFALLGRLFYRKVLKVKQFTVASNEWRSPSHDTFDDRSVWSFYNSVTAALKTAGPGNVFQLHSRLHRFVHEEVL